MATEVIMPKLGNTVESCIILEWKKTQGDEIKTGDILCDVETDKATFEVEAESDGTLLKIFFEEGDDVPVLTTIAVIGKQGENIDQITPNINIADNESERIKNENNPENKQSAQPTLILEKNKSDNINQAISPRAKILAEKKGINVKNIKGTGPNGRIIEQDVLRIINGQEPFTAGAASIAVNMDDINITKGTGIGDRITTSDLLRNNNKAKDDAKNISEYANPAEAISIKGIRKRISDFMHKSLQETAQLTLNTSADAAELLEYRRKLKSSPEELGLRNITINDLLLFCVAKMLGEHKELNAHFKDGIMYMYDGVHLANAVDTKKGLMVPVIRNADKLTLKEISKKAKMLMNECVGGTANPDDLKGSTFTVTNLGALGIESFTPILNYPEVAILGIGNIQLKPVRKNGEVVFIDHIGLSLTINHQVIDGAPAAKFLKELSNMIANINLTLAI